MSSFSSKLWEFFKIDLRASENFCDPREELYEGLPEEALYTGLEDLEAIQRHPLVEGVWVDLGCGVGHSLMLYQKLHPERRSVGVELSHSRAQEGKRAIAASGLAGATLIQGDLLEMALPEGDTYFLYFPTGPVLDFILSQLRSREYSRLVVIESHGDLLERLRLESFLTPIAEIPLKQARHHPSAVIFQGRRQEATETSPFNLSFKKKFLRIDEGPHQWIGESYGLEWQKDSQFLLRMPPRTISWEQVREALDDSDLAAPLAFVCRLRRRGECHIVLKDRKLRAELRKIAVKPSFSLELSTGQWIEWSDIQTISLGTHLCFDSSSSVFSLPPALP